MCDTPPSTPSGTRPAAGINTVMLSGNATGPAIASQAYQALHVPPTCVECLPVIPALAQAAIVAMIFLVIDVDIIFFYPWASIFAPVIQKGTPEQGRMLLLEMMIFVMTLLVAYFYAWGKGVFRWD